MQPFKEKTTLIYNVVHLWLGLSSSADVVSIGGGAGSWQEV
jgi:hypothetical protein